MHSMLFDFLNPLISLVILCNKLQPKVVVSDISISYVVGESVECSTVMFLTTRLHLAPQNVFKISRHMPSLSKMHSFLWIWCQSVRQFMKGNGSTKSLTHMSLIQSDQIGLHVAST